MSKKKNAAKEAKKEYNKALSRKIQESRENFWRLLAQMPLREELNVCFGMENFAGVDGWNKKTSNTFTVKASGRHWWEIVDDVVFHPRITVCAWNQIRNRLGEMDDATADALTKAFSDWSSARNALIENNRYFASYVVGKRFNLTGSVFDDAVAVALLSISVSVEMYNPDKGAVSTYFYPRIIRDVHDFLSKQNREIFHEDISEINEFEEDSLKSDEMNSVVMIMDILNSSFYGEKRKRFEDNFFGISFSDEKSTKMEVSEESQKEYDILLRKVKREFRE